MNEKIYRILKILIIIIIIVLALITKAIPEYKATKGSSDIYINVEKYESLVELKINNQLNFILIISEQKISNILFLDETSMCLYNKNIEGNKLQDGINQIVNILIENNILEETTSITITKYKEEHYNKTKEYLTEVIKNNGIEVVYTELTTTLEEKVKSLSLTGTDEETCIKALESYSKEIIRYQKNNVSSNSNEENETSQINSVTSKMYADSIYQKITRYANENQITNQDVSSASLPINLIPADATGTIYPTLDSWYYIKENKVYAYIVIEEDNKYSFCYQGTFENVKEGECQ